MCASIEAHSTITRYKGSNIATELGLTIGRGCDLEQSPPRKTLVYSINYSTYRPDIDKKKDKYFLRFIRNLCYISYRNGIDRR